MLYLGKDRKVEPSTPEQKEVTNVFSMAVLTFQYWSSSGKFLFKDLLEWSLVAAAALSLRWPVWLVNDGARIV